MRSTTTRRSSSVDARYISVQNSMRSSSPSNREEIASGGICGRLACVAMAAADAIHTATTRTVLDRPENVVNMMNLLVNLGSAALGPSQGQIVLAAFMRCC